MDDQMIELMAGDDILGRRLEAYAGLRLSPDLTTSSRLRARVLAVAHRQASLARADAALRVLSRPDDPAGVRAFAGRTRHAGRASAPFRRRSWDRVAGILLSATLGAAMLVGTAFAARPGGPLYESRMWAETLGLPSDPSARAVAELERLRDRLREVGDASLSGDTAGATAALAAYEAIVEQASASAILAGDEVAAAVLWTGVGQNVEVLQALAARVPANARIAITRAVDAAIARSADAIERIGASRPGGGRGDGAGSGPHAADPTPRATRRPNDRPARAPVATQTPEPKPSDPTTPEPAATPEPTPTPSRTPKPRENQGVPRPSDSADPATGGDAGGGDD